jgi:hypothetical protein
LHATLDFVQASNTGLLSNPEAILLQKEKITPKFVP